MKKLITIWLVAGFILATAGLAAADNVLLPPWAGQEGTVSAEWDSWADFPGLMLPDGWDSNPSGELYPPYAYIGSVDSPNSLPYYMGRYNVIELNGDDELKFHMTNFGNCGEDSYKDIWIQVTYYPRDPNQFFWFSVDANIVGMSMEVFEDWADAGNGWYTVALSCQIWPNPRSEEITLNFFDFVSDEPSYSAYVDQVVINTRCIPEPATMALLGLGALSLLRRKRSV